MGAAAVAVFSVMLAAAALSVESGADFSNDCPIGCECKWQSGKKAANCSNVAVIPNNLSTEIQILDLSSNPLYEITQRAFENVKLNNLFKLYLRGCKIQTVHREGFSGLQIMIELDLSKNDIEYLHPDTFRETEKLRWIFLDNNKLKKLDDYLFKNLIFLQKIKLSNNRQLESVGQKTFYNLPKLATLLLDGNNFTRVKVEALSSLTSLMSLELRDNPWKCDCSLKAFRDWAVMKKLYTSPPACAEPSTVAGKDWNDLDSSDFACKPSIIYPANGTLFFPSDTYVTLPCKVSGNPLPAVDWVLNSRIIGKSGSQSDGKYIIVEESQEHTKWYNLTIADVGNGDSSDYRCVAESPGGIAEAVVKLKMSGHGPTVNTGGIDNSMLPLLIGLSVGAAILLIVAVLLCYWCCRRRETEKMKANASTGEALIEGSVIPEMEKSLMSVNPVTKPPRRYEAPPSITSGATEMSDLNKTLLDNDSVFAPNEDERRSLDYEQPPKRSHETLSMDYTRAYPPDLLAFPPRAPQLSPAASTASTAPDTSRLHNPASPLHAPIYGLNPNLFRTLPHSRSQSPFTSPGGAPVVTPRQGYVTIPRRPRVPSWSSTTSAATQILPTAEAQEPLYDNLGLRTTADGSSVLSLNKAGLEPAFSPMRGRPLPATPTAYQSPHPVFYAPIEEHEPAPSPVPTSAYSPNPRNSVSSHHQLYSTPGPQEPVNPRMSWTAKNTSTPQPEPRKALFNGPETGSLRRNLASENPVRKAHPTETGPLRKNSRDELSPKATAAKDQGMNESNVSLNQTGTLGRNGKVPPRPPPKPKKKPNPDSSAPLFEDEGEDGTEV